MATRPATNCIRLRVLSSCNDLAIFVEKLDIDKDTNISGSKLGVGGTQRILLKVFFLKKKKHTN